jgi:Tol biopolymer transport system component
MTAFDRFERDLPMDLESLAGPHTPDYLTDILSRTATTSQRPAWTFPERWLPMADIASRRAFAPRLPWRTIALALVVITLIAVAAAAFVGSRQTKLPPPFGPAANGLVAYSQNGDIYTVDPVSGKARAVVTGPETDIDPEFSSDGTKLHFLRQTQTPGQYVIVVSNADGSDARLVSPDPVTADHTVQSSPDGSVLFASQAIGITRIDATGATLPQLLAKGRFIPGEVRPDGGAILFENDATPDTIDLWIMNADGTDKRLLYDSGSSGDKEDFDTVRWSPDGKMIAFTCSNPITHDGAHVCVMNADGSNVHRLTNQSDDWAEYDFAWAPDSRRIAFNRWQRASGSTGFVIRPIGIAAIGDPSVTDAGATPGTDGALFDWSPDGTTLLSLPARLVGSPAGAQPAKPISIDVTTGQHRDMPFEVTSGVSWQRTAP